MAQFHFVEDYERLVQNLIRELPMDEAMSKAVGGAWNEMGDLCSDALLYAGAKDGMAVLDFGCGSGRVAHFLSKKIEIPEYLGTDIVQALLDYAKSKTPSHFRYVKHHALNIPADDETFDLAYAFSVVTHLLQAESYLYMKDVHRTLKPGGIFVVSFLELAEPSHWQIFEDSAQQQKNSTLPHLNAFLERNQIEVMADKIGFTVREFISGTMSGWEASGKSLGQSMVILDKPK